MPINVPENEILLRCACYSGEHFARLIHEPNDSRGNKLKGEDDDWYLSVMLDHFRFWKRLKMGIRYIFNPLSIQYGMIAEIVLRTEDIAQLRDFLSTRLALPRPIR